MSKSFTVIFKDQISLTINDIIIFEEKQKQEISAIASEYPMKYLRDVMNTGVDLSFLTDLQKQEILQVKEQIIDGKTVSQLFTEKTVRIPFHGQDRVNERFKSVKEDACKTDLLRGDSNCLHYRKTNCEKPNASIKISKKETVYHLKMQSLKV